ncbi:MAG: class II aldolase/adducin family protein [Candidatus Saccharimonadaceae bacterium]
MAFVATKSKQNLYFSLLLILQTRLSRTEFFNQLVLLLYEYRFAISTHLQRNVLMTTTSGGNISIRDDIGDIWITPSGVDKGSLTTKDIMCLKKMDPLLVYIKLHQNIRFINL